MQLSKIRIRNYRLLIHLELSVIQLPRRLRKTSGKNYSVNLMRHAKKEPLMFLKLSTGLN